MTSDHHPTAAFWITVALVAVLVTAGSDQLTACS